MKSLSRPIALAALAAMSCSALACGMAPGDYRAYRVAFGQSTYSDSCFNDVGSMVSAQADTSSIASAGTFIVYVSYYNESVLDAGSMVLTGSFAGGEYAFDGRSTDVEAQSTTIYDSDHDGISDSSDPFVDSDGDGIEDDQDPDVDVDGDGLHDVFEDGIVDANFDGKDDRLVDVLVDAQIITVTDVEVDMLEDGDTVDGGVRVTTTISCQGAECPTNFGSTCTVTTNFDGVEMDHDELSVAPGNGPI
jgi:hypothetical protein